MTKTFLLALAASSFTAVAMPASAAFYFEGLMPHTEPPNCNDPYATTCGRYGQVPHYDGGHDHPRPARPEAGKQQAPVEMKPAPRYHTREGLEK